jgi:hypothetical protein
LALSLAGVAAALQPTQAGAPERQGIRAESEDSSEVIEPGCGGEAQRPAARPVRGGGPSDPIDAEAYACTTKCAIESESSKCTGWVVGEGTDRTESDACKAAKADANRNVERLLPGEGCKAKHCRPCDCQKRK